MSLDNTNFVHVTVRYHGGDNKARAGFGLRAKMASSTNSPEIAARAAAAKYFRCRESNVALRVTQIGSSTGAPWLMTATRKDAP